MQLRRSAEANWLRGGWQAWVRHQPNWTISISRRSGLWLSWNCSAEACSTLTDLELAQRGVLPYHPWQRSRHYTDSYIGTWVIDEARLIAAALRSHGYTVRIYGRGPNRPKGCGGFSRGLPLGKAVHGAVYVYDSPSDKEVERQEMERYWAEWRSLFDAYRG